MSTPAPMSLPPPFPPGGGVVVCPLDRLVPGRGVGALVHGRPIALFLLPSGALHAIDGVDPCCGAAVLARGITGSHTVDGEAVPTVASPMHKQRFDLRTGRCLDADVAVATWPVRARDGRVELGAAPRS